MTALLTADEAHRLRPGEQLVIVRAGDVVPRVYELRSRPVNVVAPQDWVALTGPCPTCRTKPTLISVKDKYGRHLRWDRCPDCRDGRRIEPLYTECPVCMDRAEWCGYGDGLPDDNPRCEVGRVLVGRGSVEVVPVVAKDIHGEAPDAYVYVLADGRAFLCRGDDEWPFGVLDRQPVPGRDWGIIIDCVEVTE